MIYVPVIFGMGVVLLSTLELLSQFNLRINESNDLLITIDHFGDIINITYINQNCNSKKKINEFTKSYKCKNNTLICPLTQDYIPINSQVRELNCSHVFTQNNIDIWLKKNNSCPICRNIVFSKN